MTSHNTIIQGDCTTAMANLDPASVDFVLTDPPYLPLIATAAAGL